MLKKLVQETFTDAHDNKIVRFDWSAVFASFWYKKRARNRAAFCSVQVFCTSVLSVSVSPQLDTGETCMSKQLCHFNAVCLKTAEHRRTPQNAVEKTAGHPKE